MFLNLILLKIDLIPIVITIHNDRNGVPGPNQNNQQALPKANIALEKSLPQVIAPNKYGSQTSIETTKKTMKKIKNVLQSFIFLQIQING